MALVGAAIIVFSHASSPTATVNNTAMHESGNAYVATDTNASNGTFVMFGPNIAYGGASPGGTYADWYYPGSGLQSIEWTEVPVQDPAPSLAAEGLLHYYAYTFSLNNSTSAIGFGYAGFQTNGIFNGTQEGKVINFSFWGNTGGDSPSPGLVNPSNQESGGYQIMFPFVWTVSHKYAFQLKPGPGGTSSSGKWWGLYVQDLNTSVTTYVGEELMPTTIGGLDSSLIETHTGAFGEDLHWWNSLDGSTKYSCSDFQNSSMATINVTANGGTVKPSSFSAYTNSLQPSTDSDNGYKTTNCPVTNYTDTNNNVQMNLGYWSPEASNYLSSL
jgi:hypothetical protein